MKTLIALMAVTGLLACSRHEESHQHEVTTTTTTTPSSASAVPYDLQFLDTMTKHHQGAIEMSRMAAGKIQHADLAKLAASIPDAQQKEIDQMRAWRDQWYPGRAAAGNMDMPGMAGSMMDMEHMQSMQRGKAYDAMFIDMMIPHHEGALTMSRDALAKAEHPEVKELAQRIIDAQAAEIQRMREWKSQIGK
jgi:uncharacterized protein (DUF305 family)